MLFALLSEADCFVVSRSCTEVLYQHQKAPQNELYSVLTVDKRAAQLQQAESPRRTCKKLERLPYEVLPN